MSVKFRKIGLSFNNAELQKFDEEKAAKAKEGQGKFIEAPGIYEVQIESIKKFPEPCEDPTWVNTLITVKAANGKIVNGWVKIPTAHEAFIRPDGSHSLSQMSVFRNFATALGLPDADEAAARCLYTDLVGKNVRVETGYPYKSLHLQYEAGGGFTVVDHNNKPYPLAQGKVFPKREDAELWAGLQTPPVRFRFMEIKKFLAPTMPNIFEPVEWEEEGAEPAVVAEKPVTPEPPKGLW